MERYAHETGITLDAAVASRHGWVKMNRSGRLTTKKGYAWDGPSGPAIDSKNFMRGSLVHDALYQLMRQRLLPQRARRRADQLLRDICRQDGMSKGRADYVYHAVRVLGGSSARPPRKPKQVRTTAP